MICEDKKSDTRKRTKEGYLKIQKQEEKEEENTRKIMEMTHMESYCYKCFFQEAFTNISTVQYRQILF